MPPTRHDYEAALQEIEEDTMPPGMTQQQYADAREMMEQLEDVEFYEAMSDREYSQIMADFLASNPNQFLEAFAESPVDDWSLVGARLESRFCVFAVKAMRDKYRTSGELLECVREAVMGVEA
jgi:hypothetical protein